MTYSCQAYSLLVVLSVVTMNLVRIYYLTQWNFNLQLHNRQEWLFYLGKYNQCDTVKGYFLLLADLTTCVYMALTTVQLTRLVRQMNKEEDETGDKAVDKPMVALHFTLIFA